MPGLEGEFELQIHGSNTRYTTLEWRGIKQKTGLLPLDFEEHSEKLDPDVFASALWVTLIREGHDPKFVWDALDNSDLFDADKFSEVEEPQEEEDAVPPASTPPSTDDGNETKPDAEPERSGESSTPPLALLENPPSPTGFPRSATGAA